MRVLLFKNLTSVKKMRRCLSISESITEDGVQAKSQRHVIYAVKEVPCMNDLIEKPTLTVLKFHNTKTKTDKLFCKMKGKSFAFQQEHTYLISFVHTLRIELVDQGSVQAVE